MYGESPVEKPSGIPEFLKGYIEGALLEEVFTTPKPGLVDYRDNGAHQDMNIGTFIASTHAIAPYLLKMAYEGYLWKDGIEDLFPIIQKIGIQAEKAMFRATGGVNTHKGIIFTMGILCAASGVCYKQRGIFKVTEILELSRRMMNHKMDIEFQKMKSRKPITHGEWLYHTYGEKGIRGEAQLGFPIIKDVAYPAMKDLRKTEKKEMMTNINVLLRIMITLNDTNILSRSNYQELQWLKETSRSILKLGGALTQEGYHEIVKMNEKCIEKNISPGGSADILAATLFLYRLEH